MKINITTPIQRLREFIAWAKSQKLCKSESDFERRCQLSSKYVVNNLNTGKGNIGTEILGRITKVYPQLNLSWLCTGEGVMILSEGGSVDMDYKKAYEGVLMQVEALNKIIKKMDSAR